ncbi:MAG: M48 family metalloprotease [Polyangiaceae bacterium]|nr:M48 family metalloprotease [Polyangiaceae bacterium]
MRLIPFALPVLLAIAACGAESLDTIDEDHTAGAYVPANDPYYWAPSSFDDFIANTLGGDVGPTAPDDDPLTVRVQAWMDRVDSIVRADVKRRTGQPLAAPRPLAKVRISRSTLNAWVSPVRTCTGLALGPQPSTGFARMEPESLSFSGSSSSCIMPTAPGWSPDGFVRFWNAARFSCSIAQSGGLRVAEGNVCTQTYQRTGPFDTTTTLASKDVSVTATGQYVLFSTDLLATCSETELAATVAHELGHYYGAHASPAAEKNFGYWYQRDERSIRKPVPAPNAEEIQAAYLEVVRGTGTTGPSFASQFSARLRPLLLLAVAPLLSERREANFVCAPARDALGSWVPGFLRDPNLERAAYLTFESKLIRCAPTLKLGAEPGSEVVSAGTLLFSADKHRPGPKSRVTLMIGDTLESFLTRLDREARVLDEKAARLIQRVRENKMGLYTVEQAADDFSLELATKLGFTTAEVLESWLAGMRVDHESYLRSSSAADLAAYYASIGEYDPDACAALLRNDFTKDDGSGHRIPVTLSLGDLEEPHHTNCYRLWNLANEAKAHKYPVGPRLPALSPAWSEIRARAATLTSQAQD